VARRESSVISPGESVLLVAEEPNGDTHLCNSRTFEASRQVSWLLALAVKPGELDNFRALMKEMVESTRRIRHLERKNDWSANAGLETRQRVVEPPGARR
jgi:hypothetical protein